MSICKMFSVCFNEIIYSGIFANGGWVCHLFMRPMGCNWNTQQIRNYLNILL